MKILIYGSCVTNDIFSSVESAHKIAAYIPRLSMAAAFGKAAPDFIIEAAKKNIGSLTHRYWVLNDLEKRMGKILSSTSYDIIILDFVDEKNNLGLIDGSVLTMTDEFKKTNIDESILEIVPSMSEKHYELWKDGLDIFSKHVDQKKVFLNKVYWAQRMSDGAQFSLKWVIENNIFLEKLYSYVEENYNFNVIDYDRSIFIGDSSHKHGKSPYHFTHEYYQHAMNLIDGIENNKGQCHYKNIDLNFLRNYRLRYTISPWPTHDIVLAAKSALNNRFILPNVGTVDMSTGIDWGFGFHEASNSKRLWLHSLPFVDDLVQAHAMTGDEAFWRHALFLLNDYLGWVELADSNRHLAFSDEHAVVNRCCVFSSMLHSLWQHGKATSIADIPLETTLLNAIMVAGEWLASDDHYIYNNHGIMMDRVLLQVSVQLATHDGAVALIWQETAIRRLAMMAGRTFDSDGCCTENSPAYHMLNLTLYSRIIDFLRDHEIQVCLQMVDEIKNLIGKATEVAPLFLRDDGTLPTIGDTELKSSQFMPARVLKDNTRTGCFPDAGFAIINTPEVQVTVKCGGSTYSHRHVDDTSLTLRYCGVDLIVDAGMYNYDIGDKLRRWFLSYQAHSGFFVEACEKVRFANFTGPRALARITDFHDDQDCVLVAMESNLVDGVQIEREVIFIPPNVIVIKDKMRANKPQRWRQQFLLHPDCRLQIEGTRTVISRGDVGCELRQHITQAQPLPESAWYSERFMQHHDTKCLVYGDEGITIDLITTIRAFGGKSKEMSQIEIDQLTDDGTLKSLNLIRTLRIPQRCEWKQTILPDSWLSSDKAIQATGQPGPDTIRFVCNTIDSFGYIQTFGKSFEKILLNEAGGVPFGAKSAELSLMLHIVSSDLDASNAYAGLFFMGYDADGVRIANIQQIFYLRDRTVPLNSVFKLGQDVKFFKIAMKISNLQGLIELHPGVINFSAL